MMKYTLALLALMAVAVIASQEMSLSPDGSPFPLNQVAESGMHSRSALDSTCGSGHLNFHWGASRSALNAEVFFFMNGTFHDNSYNYSGSWKLFGEEGENILVFNYPSALYCAPSFSRQAASGTMVSGDTCGTWFFDDMKWNCENTCYL